MSQILQESAGQFFKDEIEAGLSRHGIGVQGATAAYLMFMLERFLPVKGDPSIPVVFQSGYADLLVGERRQKRLKEIGDEALLTSGFFRNSRQPPPVYYASFGARAYRKLSLALCGRRLSSLFDELAEKFLPLSQILAEMGERSRSTTDSGLLVLYQEWLETRRPYLHQLLVGQGIVLRERRKRGARLN